MISLFGHISAQVAGPSAAIHWSETGDQLQRQWRCAWGSIATELDESHRISIFTEGVIIHDGRIEQWNDDPRNWNGAFLALRFGNDPEAGVEIYTDRLGTIPIYWGADDKRIWFSTKLSGLAREGFRTVDRIGAWQLVLFNQPLWQRTLLEGVSLFPPASRIRLRIGRAPQIERYWEAAANPSQTGNADRLLQDLIGRISHAHVRAVPSGRKLVCPVTGGLDSRMNLALHRAQWPDALLFHSYSSGSEEFPIAKRISQAIAKPLLCIPRVEGALSLVDRSPDKETGELNMSQWVFESTVAKAALAAPGHVLLDGYMQDVLFNPLIATADAEPATLAAALSGATYRYRMLGRDPTDRCLAEILDLFRVEYALDRATCPLQASQRYYLENRSRRYVFGATRLAQNHLPVALAGIDSELLDFGFGLPWGLRHGAVLYRRAIVQTAPQLAAIAYDKTGLPVTSSRKMAWSLILKRRLIANLEVVWPSRPFLCDREASLGEILRRNPDVAERTHRVLAESSWVRDMLGGADQIDKILKICSQGGRFDQILYPLLTLAKLERLLVSDDFDSSQNGRDGKLRAAEASSFFDPFKSRC